MQQTVTVMSQWWSQHTRTGTRNAQGSWWEKLSTPSYIRVWFWTGKYEFCEGCHVWWNWKSGTSVTLTGKINSSHLTFKLLLIKLIVFAAVSSSTILSIALFLHCRPVCLSVSVRAEGMFFCFCVSTHASYDDWNEIKRLLRFCIYSKMHTLFSLATPPPLLYSFSSWKENIFILTKIYLPKSLSYGKELHPPTHVCKFLF